MILYFGAYSPVDHNKASDKLLDNINQIVAKQINF